MINSSFDVESSHKHQNMFINHHYKKISDR